MFGQKKAKLVGGLVFAAHLKPIIPQNVSATSSPIFWGLKNSKQKSWRNDYQSSNQNLREIPLNPGWLNLKMTLYNPSLTG